MKQDKALRILKLLKKITKIEVFDMVYENQTFYWIKIGNNDGLVNISKEDYEIIKEWLEE